MKYDIIIRPAEKTFWHIFPNGDPPPHDIYTWGDLLEELHALANEIPQTAHPTPTESEVQS
jgi:hypothetical protein